MLALLPTLAALLLQAHPSPGLRPAQIGWERFLKEPVQLAACIDVRSGPVAEVIDEDSIRFDQADGKSAVATLEPNCSDFGYHGYASYVPTNNQLCAARDRLVSREGYSCKILAVQVVDSADLTEAVKAAERARGTVAP